MGTFTASVESSSSIKVFWDFTADIAPGVVQSVTIEQTDTVTGATTTHNEQAVYSDNDLFGNLHASRTYTYQLSISYVDEFGDLTSAGATASAMTPAAPSPPPPHATAPGSVTAVATSYDTASVTWTAGSHMSGYTISRLDLATNATTTLQSNRSPSAGLSYGDTIAPTPTAGAQFSYTVEAYNAPPGTSAGTASNIITMPLQPVKITPSATQPEGGQDLTCTVTLSGTAPAQGAVVTLASSSADLVAPPMTTVAAGQSVSPAFMLTTQMVTAATSVTLSASLGGGTASQGIVLEPPRLAQVSVAANPVVGGGETTGLVTMVAAPTAPIQVALASNSPVVSVPATIAIAAYQSQSAPFTVTTHPVTAATVATITASYGASSAACTLGVTPLQLANFSISPSTVVGGHNTTATLTLNGNAPTAAAVTVSTLPMGLADVSGSTTIPAGHSTTTFTLTTAGISGLSTPRVVAVTAAYGGVSQSVNLTIDPSTPPPITLVSLAMAPTTLAAGLNAVGTVTISAAAPAAGAVVALFATTDAATPVPVLPGGGGSSLVTIPASVTVPAGQTSAKFDIRTHALGSSSSPQHVTIGATLVTSKYVELTLT
jgi:hypothetical protein